MSPARMIVNETKAKAMKDRPDSKLTSSLLTSPSILEPEVLEEGREEEYDEDDDESRNGDEQQQSTSPQPIKKVLITHASLASVASQSFLLLQDLLRVSVQDLYPLLVPLDRRVHPGKHRQLLHHA